MGTGLPGLDRTVAVAGHRTTYLAPFADIDQLRRGEPIVLTMPYGRFTYRVQATRIVDPGALWVTRGRHGRLVLTSCHPPFSAAERIVVFARLVGTQANRATSA
jgi:sortase A